jgi:hypothetical protein
VGVSVPLWREKTRQREERPWNQRVKRVLAPPVFEEFCLLKMNKFKDMVIEIVAKFLFGNKFKFTDNIQK